MLDEDSMPLANMTHVHHTILTEHGAHKMCNPFTIFTYDEAHALVEMDVLNVNEDKHSKRSSPHQRLTEHLVQVAAKVVHRITSSATRAQRIYVLTADVHATVVSLLSCQMPHVVVYINQIPVNGTV